MKKRILSCLMALALCLTLLPTAALAEGTEGMAQTSSAVGKAADPANGEAKKENQPAALEQEKQSTEQGEQQEDSAAKQDEAVADVQALSERFSQLAAPAEGTGHTNHPICGETGCTEHVTDITDWVGVDTLTAGMEAGHYYLTKNVTIDSTWQPQSGTVLCLNGNSITATGSFDAITIGKDVTFTLCDCKVGQTGTVAALPATRSAPKAAVCTSAPAPLTCTTARSPATTDTMAAACISTPK